MTSKKSFTLSDYQRASLTQMGVTLWMEHSPQAVDHSLPEPEVSNKSTERKQGLPDAIAQFKTAKATPVETHTPQVQSYPDAVIVTHAGVENSSISTDVLMALGLQDAQIEYKSSQALSDFSDYHFAWLQADDISLQGNVLSTPRELDAKAKKQLWAQIVKHGH